MSASASDGAQGRASTRATTTTPWWTSALEPVETRLSEVKKGLMRVSSLM